MVSNLVWFRADLRVHDNPALHAAMQAGSCVAVYCLTPNQWDMHDVSEHKRSLVVRQLLSLADKLAELNVPLKVLNCGTFSMVESALAELCCQIGITNVYCNHEYELNERELTREVEMSLESVRVGLHAYHDQCAIEPGQILNQSGEMYQVYSAFKQRYYGYFDSFSRTLSSKPQCQAETGLESDTQALQGYAIDANLAALWPAGEDEAHDRLEAFIENGVKAYKDHRDFPDIDGTSTLSPYLAIGALTTRQCLHAMISLNGGVLQSDHPGIQTWTNEIIWREFYRHFLFAHPDLCQHKPFKRNTDALPWSRDTGRFEAWCEGRTGYPIVDAGMRQLNQTGWMHNRLRMVCAMFLTKHLMVDWRLGEQYFMSRLIDADFASNNGGWQWSASTGVDAVPYFRIFNPTRQSERFDKEGCFIRRYVDELASLDGRSIHDPSPEQRVAFGYPTALVEHRGAVERTKALFSALSKQEGVHSMSKQNKQVGVASV